MLLHKNIYFESIVILLQAVDKQKKMFLQDLFTIDTFREIFFSLSQIHQQWFMHCVLEYL